MKRYGRGDRIVPQYLKAVRDMPIIKKSGSSRLQLTKLEAIFINRKPFNNSLHSYRESLVRELKQG